MKRILLVLFAVFLSRHVVSQTASRVVAFAGYGTDTTGAPLDTGGYKYAPSRGGEMSNSPAPFRCDYPFVYVPATDFETGHEGITKFDSSWELGPGDTDVSEQFYDENGNIIYSSRQLYADGVWQNNATISYTYDKNNNLLQEIDTFWKSGEWLNISMNSYSYDSANRDILAINLSKTSGDSNWFTGGKTQYYYDATDKLDSLVGMYWDEKSNSWTPKNDLITTFFYAGNQPDTFIDIITDPGSGGALGIYYFSPASDTMIVNYYSFDNYLRITNTYDTHHNKTSFTQEVLDSSIDWLSNIKTEWTYNSYNQVITEKNYNKSFSGNWVFASLNRYYYETYETEVPFNINSMAVFPSPAQNRITIKIEWDKPQPFLISIFDAAGRRAMQWSEASTQQYEKTIYLPNFPSGNYFIRATSGNQKLVKQFVVLN